MLNHIDINVDVGEGFGNESQYMSYISSCNIACGGHSGNLETMGFVAALAKKHHVKIGAHPSFPDKKNFGRKIVEMSPESLYTSIKSQIYSLIDVLNEHQVVLHHIKPHGALYNLAAIDNATAQVIINVIQQLDFSVKLYVPYRSVIAQLALKNNIPIVYEAFADRNYNADLTLVSRESHNALISNVDEAFEHIRSMVISQKVKTTDGDYVDIKAETFCVHGDHPNAVNLIIDLVNRLKKSNTKM